MGTAMLFLNPHYSDLTVSVLKYIYNNIRVQWPFSVFVLDLKWLLPLSQGNSTALSQVGQSCGVSKDNGLTSEKRQQHCEDHTGVYF